MILCIHIERLVNNMKRVVVEMEKDLHKEIKTKALQLDKSIKNYVLDLIKKDLEKKGE